MTANREAKVGKYRFEAIVVWSQGQKVFTQKHIPIDFFAAGNSWAKTPLARSDYCTNETEISNLEMLIMESQSLGIVFPLINLLHFSRTNWKIDAVAVGAYEGYRHISSIIGSSPRPPVRYSEKGKWMLSFIFDSSVDPYGPGMIGPERR